MNKPTKGQLAAAVAHYELSLQALIEGPALDGQDLLDAVKAVVESAPSLEPVTKVQRDDDHLEARVDPEAPATE